MDSLISICLFFGSGFGFSQNLCACFRAVVACRVSSDDGDSGADDTDAAVRLSRARMGGRVPMLDHDGGGDFLLLLPHVQGARPL